MTIILGGTYTIIDAGTSTLQRTARLSSLGMSYTRFAERPTCSNEALRTCSIGNNTLIGSSTQVNENTCIAASVIGRDCIIGAGTTIRDSYIFEGTVVGSDCVIERSIIGANVTIKDQTRVSKGCLVGDGVIVGPSAVLRAFERLSKRPDENEKRQMEEDEDVDSDLEDVEASAFRSWSSPYFLTHKREDQDPLLATLLGESSNALVWPRASPGEDDEEEEIIRLKNERFMRLGNYIPLFKHYPCSLHSASGDDASDLDFSEALSDSSISESESESDFDPDLGPLTSPSDTSLSLNMRSVGLAMGSSEFEAEVKQSLERAFAEGHSVDNAAVELKTLRMASNVPLTQVRRAVVAAIVERIEIIPEGGLAQRKEIAGVVGRWGELIDRIGGVDPVETVTVLQVTFLIKSHPQIC